MEKREGVKRVLITSIGGGNIENAEGKMELKKYHNTVYSINNKKYEITTYMPKVVEEEFEVDKTIIIGTTGTMWDNVYSQYCIKNGKEIDETYVKNLREIERESDKNTPIEDLNINKFNEEFGNSVKGIIIKYGLNREEIFENFNSIIQLEEEFNDEDEYEVILDITHSFRSTAFWMFLVMTYLTDVSNKNIKIIEVTYGMHEITRKNDDSSPIILLNSFLEILNWIKGASELKQYGNSYYILENLKGNKDIPKEIEKELENFSNAMNMNYVGSLLESLDKLADLEKDKKLDSIVGPAKHIIPDVLRKFIYDFDIRESNDNRRKYLLQATLAKWHFEQKRYAMAAININESLANYVANSLNLREEDSTKFDPNSEAKNWLRDLYNLDNINDIYRKYAEVYHHTRRIRNEIAHSLGNEIKILDDIKLLEEFSKIIVDLLEDENIIKNAEKELHLLDNIPTKKITESTAIEDNFKVEVNNNVSPKSILILSTRILDENEKNELKRKLKLNKIYTLKEDNIQRWRDGTDRDIAHLKKVVSQYLKEGDYILIHGNYFPMNRMYSFANSKGLKTIFLSERFSPEDEYFKEI
ncbi:TIGR02221 family CRISPR-associated protein [Fusobacterium pseudoperiodonticum]|uniref:TIGR02221 family CRISPR-associated protein n=1 Tax=Fusobacterium pseudoperiodonticum TaxID=2663009 RepID=UPI000C1B8F1F|nr:TIGR02221 family CRISPR-associated protein [Fusobacterium pseudoperiodonticum]ATV73396.1 TIGR02221 family CRISPR-associated protein [Fusobacterium pseudoperiodonticum]